MSKGENYKFLVTLLEKIEKGEHIEIEITDFIRRVTYVLSDYYNNQILSNSSSKEADVLPKLLRLLADGIEEMEEIEEEKESNIK